MFSGKRFQLWSSKAKKSENEVPSSQAPDHGKTTAYRTETRDRNIKPNPQTSNKSTAKRNSTRTRVARDAGDAKNSVGFSASVHDRARITSEDAAFDTGCNTSTAVCNGVAVVSGDGLAERGAGDRELLTRKRETCDDVTDGRWRRPEERLDSSEAMEVVRWQDGGRVSEYEAEERKMEGEIEVEGERRIATATDYDASVLHNLQLNYARLEETVKSLVPYKIKSDELENRLMIVVNKYERKQRMYKMMLRAIKQENVELLTELRRLRSNCDSCYMCSNSNSCYSGTAAAAGQAAASERNAVAAEAVRHHVRGHSDLQPLSVAEILKSLEVQHSALLAENWKQVENYNRCLDDIYQEVGAALRCQQELREQCSRLQGRVMSLEQQNQQLLLRPRSHATPTPSPSSERGRSAPWNSSDPPGLVSRSPSALLHRHSPTFLPSEANLSPASRSAIHRLPSPRGGHWPKPSSARENDDDVISANSTLADKDTATNKSGAAPDATAPSSNCYTVAAPASTTTVAASATGAVTSNSAALVPDEQSKPEHRHLTLSDTCRRRTRSSRGIATNAMERPRAIREHLKAEVTMTPHDETVVSSGAGHCQNLTVEVTRKSCDNFKRKCDLKMTKDEDLVCRTGDNTVVFADGISRFEEGFDFGDTPGLKDYVVTTNTSSGITEVTSPPTTISTTNLTTATIHTQRSITASTVRTSVTMALCTSLKNSDDDDNIIQTMPYTVLPADDIAAVEGNIDNCAADASVGNTENLATEENSASDDVIKLASSVNPLSTDDKIYCFQTTAIIPSDISDKQKDLGRSDCYRSTIIPAFPDTTSNNADSIVIDNDEHTPLTSCSKYDWGTILAKDENREYRLRKRRSKSLSSRASTVSLNDILDEIFSSVEPGNVLSRSGRHEFSETDDDGDDDDDSKESNGVELHRVDRDRELNYCHTGRGDAERIQGGGVSCFAEIDQLNRLPNFEFQDRKCNENPNVQKPPQSLAELAKIISDKIGFNDWTGLEEQEQEREQDSDKEEGHQSISADREIVASSVRNLNFRSNDLDQTSYKRWSEATNRSLKSGDTEETLGEGDTSTETDCLSNDCSLTGANYSASISSVESDTRPMHEMNRNYMQGYEQRGGVEGNKQGNGNENVPGEGAININLQGGDEQGCVQDDVEGYLQGEAYGNVQENPEESILENPLRSIQGVIHGHAQGEERGWSICNDPETIQVNPDPETDPDQLTNVNLSVCTETLFNCLSKHSRNTNDRLIKTTDGAFANRTNNVIKLEDTKSDKSLVIESYKPQTSTNQQMSDDGGYSTNYSTSSSNTEKITPSVARRKTIANCTEIIINAQQISTDCLARTDVSEGTTSCAEMVTTATVVAAAAANLRPGCESKRNINRRSRSLDDDSGCREEKNTQVETSVNISKDMVSLLTAYFEEVRLSKLRGSEPPIFVKFLERPNSGGKSREMKKQSSDDRQIYSNDNYCFINPTAVNEDSAPAAEGNVKSFVSLINCDNNLNIEQPDSVNSQNFVVSRLPVFLRETSLIDVELSVMDKKANTASIEIKSLPVISGETGSTDAKLNGVDGEVNTVFGLQVVSQADCNSCHNIGQRYAVKNNLEKDSIHVQHCVSAAKHSHRSRLSQVRSEPACEDVCTERTRDQVCTQPNEVCANPAPNRDCTVPYEICAEPTRNQACVERPSATEVYRSSSMPTVLNKPTDCFQKIKINYVKACSLKSFAEVNQLLFSDLSTKTQQCQDDAQDAGRSEAFPAGNFCGDWSLENQECAADALFPVGQSHGKPLSRSANFPGCNQRGRNSIQLLHKSGAKSANDYFEGSQNRKEHLTMQSPDCENNSSGYGNSRKKKFPRKIADENLSKALNLFEIGLQCGRSEHQTAERGEGSGGGTCGIEGRCVGAAGNGGKTFEQVLEEICNDVDRMAEESQRFAAHHDIADLKRHGDMTRIQDDENARCQLPENNALQMLRINYRPVDRQSTKPPLPPKPKRTSAPITIIQPLSPLDNRSLPPKPDQSQLSQGLFPLQSAFNGDFDETSTELFCKISSVGRHSATPTAVKTNKTSQLPVENSDITAMNLKRKTSQFNYGFLARTSKSPGFSQDVRFSDVHRISNIQDATAKSTPRACLLSNNSRGYVFSCATPPRTSLGRGGLTLEGRGQGRNDVKSIYASKGQGQNDFTSINGSRGQGYNEVISTYEDSGEGLNDVTRTSAGWGQVRSDVTALHVQPVFQSEETKYTFVVKDASPLLRASADVKTSNPGHKGHDQLPRTNIVENLYSNDVHASLFKPIITLNSESLQQRNKIVNQIYMPSHDHHKRNLQLAQPAPLSPSREQPKFARVVKLPAEPSSHNCVDQRLSANVPRCRSAVTDVVEQLERQMNLFDDVASASVRQFQTNISDRYDDHIRAGESLKFTEFKNGRDKSQRSVTNRSYQEHQTFASIANIESDGTGSDAKFENDVEVGRPSDVNLGSDVNPKPSGDDDVTFGEISRQIDNLMEAVQRLQRQRRVLGEGVEERGAENDD